MQQSPRLNPIIRPSPVIKIFKCNMKKINTDRQLEYVMEKFTHLERLDVQYERMPVGHTIPRFSGQMLSKFTRYVTPHASLDLFEWEEVIYENGPLNGPDIYIKLQTESGLRYYMGNRREFFIVDQRRYIASAKHIRFDITCKDLKAFKMRGHHFPQFNCDFVFTNVLS